LGFSETLARLLGISPEKMKAFEERLLLTVERIDAIHEAVVLNGGKGKT